MKTKHNIRIFVQQQYESCTEFSSRLEAHSEKLIEDHQITEAPKITFISSGNNKYTAIFEYHTVQSQYIKNTFSTDEIRNKLSPMKNLIAMIEESRVFDKDELFLQEIAQCKKSIEDLSGGEIELDNPFLIIPE